MPNGFDGETSGINLNPKTIAVNIVTEIAPNMTNVAVSAAEGLRDLRDFLNKSRSSLNIQKNQLDKNPLVQSTDNQFERSGGNIDSDTKSINEELDMISDNFDDIMGDFPEIEVPEIDADPNMKATANALRGSEATTRMTAAAASATVSSIGKMTKVLAKSQARTAAYIAKSQSNASLISMSKVNTQLIGVNKRLDVLNSNVAKLVEFNNRNISITNQRFIQYMENSEKTMQAFATMLSNDTSKKRYNDNFSLLDYGYIDPGALKDHIKKNSKNTILGTGQLFMSMMKSSLFSDGKLYGGSGASRQGMSVINQVGNGMVENYVKMLLPAVITSSLNKLDKNLFNYMRHGILALGDGRSTNPLMSLLGELVGVKNVSRNIRLDKYNKEATPWNGVDHKYLTEVIPHYLANIEKGVLGLNEARYFDADKGRFFTESDLEKRLKKERERNVYEFDDVARMLQEATSAHRDRLDREGADLQALTASLNTLINERLKSNNNTDPDYVNKVKKAFRDTNTNLFNDDQMREFIMSLENAIYNGRSRDTRFMGDIQSNLNGAGYRNLLVNGESYRSRMRDLDFFKDAVYDRRGKRHQQAPEMDTPEYDEWLQNERMYEASSWVSDRLENPARRVLGKVSNRYEGLRNRNALLSLLLPEFRITSGESVNEYAGTSPYRNARGDRITQLDRNLFYQIYGGQATTDAEMRARRGRPTKIARRSKLTRRRRTTPGVDVDVAERMSESQQDDLERNINAEVEGYADQDTDQEATVAESIQQQTEAITASNAATHKLFALNLGKVFGKDGKIAKLLQSDTLSKFKKKATRFLFGNKGEDKVYRDGIFSSIANKFLDGIDYFKHAINGEAYTDRSGKHHEASTNSVLGFLRKGYDKVFSGTMKYLFGEDYKNDETYQKYLSWADRDVRRARKEERRRQKEEGPYAGRRRIRIGSSNTQATQSDASVGSGEATDVSNASGAIQNVVNTAVQSATTTIEAAVGDNSSASSKEKGALAKFKRFMPKALTAGVIGGAIPLLSGGSMGLLGSMFLPGGPVSGAILGLGSAIIARSETFQRIVFGDKDQDGKRTGGLINQKMRESLKKLSPAMIGGATIGVLKGLLTGGAAAGPMGLLFGSLLPGGVIGAALFGAGSSILMRSEKFNQILFGTDGDKDGGRTLKDRLGKKMTGVTNGLKKSMNFITGGIKGIGAGLITGAMVSQMGILGSALGVGGPIGFGIAGLGLGIASQTKKFKEYFWGTEELDENGNPTGKKKNGLVGKFQNYMQLEVFEPIASKAEEAMVDMAYWAKESVVSPINKAFGPLVNNVKDIKQDISDAIHGAFQTVADTITDHTKKVMSKLFSPVGKFMMEKILKPAGKATLGVAKGAAEVTVGAAMMPVRALGYLTGAEQKRKQANDSFEADLRAGNIAGFSPDADLSTEEMIAAKQAWAAQNHPDRNMSWMWQDEQNKLTRVQRREARARYGQDRRIRKIRTKFLEADKYDQNADISFRTFETRKKRLALAGYDVSNMNSIDDMRNFMYNQDDNRQQAQQAQIVQEQVQREEIRDNRDENYQRTVVDLLTDQVNILSGGTYRRIKRRGTPISDRDANAVNISPTEQANIMTTSVTNALATHSEQQARVAEDRADDEREAAESAQARSLTSRRDDAPTEAVTREVSKKGVAATVKDGASSILNWLKKPENAVLATLGTAVAAPMIANVVKDCLPDVGRVIGNGLVDAVKLGTGFVVNGIIGGTKSLVDLGKEKMLSLFEGVSNTASSLKMELLGGDEVAAIDENGNLMYNDDGSLVMGQTAGMYNMMGATGRVAAGSLLGQWKNQRTYNAVAGLGKGVASAAGALGRNTVGLFKSGFSNLGSGIKSVAGKAKNTLLNGNILNGARYAGAAAKGALSGAAKGVFSNRGIINRTVHGLAGTVSGAKSAVSKSREKVAAKAASGETLKHMDVGTALKKASEIMKDLFNKAKSNKAITKIIESGIIDKISKAVLDGLAKASVSNKTIVNIVTKKLIPGIFEFFGKAVGAAATAGVTAAAFAVWDASNGYLEAASIFDIDESDVTWEMRMASAALKGFTGFFGIAAILDAVFEIISVATGGHNTPERTFARIIYSCIVAGNDEKLKQLKNAQLEYDEKAKAWCEATGKSVNDYDNLRYKSGFSTIKSGVSKTVTSVVNTTKNVASSAWNGIKDGWNATFGSKKKSTGSGIGYGEGFGVPQMSQYDPRWSGMTLGMNNGSAYNMAQGGCGPTSLAMVANSMGRGVTPGQVGALARDNGYAVSGGSSKELFTEGASKLGLRSRTVGSSGIESQLKSGHPVILSGKGSGNDTPYTKVGHIVTASGMDGNGNVIVNDPRYNSPSKYPMSKVKQGMKHGWSYDSIGSGDEFGNNNAVFYRQSDSRWGSTPYGSSTIGKIGCIMTSLAMALSSLTGQTITPGTVVNKWGNSHWVKGAGTSWNIMGDAARDTGLDVKKSLNATEILNAAYQRKPVVMWGKKGPGSIFGNGGSKSQGFHSVIAINGNPETGQILFNDPGKTKGQNLVIDKSAISGNIKQGYIFSKNGKGIGNIDPSAIANGTPVDGGISSGTMGTSDGTTGGASSSGITGVLSPFANAINKIGTIAMNSFDKKMSEGSGDETTGGDSLSISNSGVFGKLSDALGKIANIVSADAYSKLYGVSYSDAKIAMQNQSETAGTDGGIQYDPNANASVGKYGKTTEFIINKDLSKFGPVTAADMNGWFQRVRKDSPFNGQGQAFLDASKVSGLDPRYIAAHAAWETGWGTSAIARDKNNYFGIGAFDSSPYASAYSFGTGLPNGIAGGAKWIADHYTNKGYNTIAKMKAKGYATDIAWANGIASVMKGAPPDPLNDGGSSVNLKGPSKQDTATMNNPLLSGSWTNERLMSSVGSGADITSMSDQKYGVSGIDATRSQSISDKLNVALKADGVENKLDTLIGVVKDIFDVASEKNGSVTLNVGSGDTVNINGRKSSKGGNNTIVVNDKKKTSSLRNIHELIAKVVPTSA